LEEAFGIEMDEEFLSDANSKSVKDFTNYILAQEKP
jgi:acyl carrier protein